MAFFDTVGVASIVPFVTVLANPNSIETIIYLNKLYSYIQNYQSISIEQFQITIGLIVFFIFLISVGFKSLTIFFQTRFTMMCEYSIGLRILKNYLKNNYNWYIDRNNSNFSKVILSEVNQLVYQSIIPLMNLLSLILVASGIILLIFLFNPEIAIIIMIIFGSSYIFIYICVRKYLNTIGTIRNYVNKQRFHIISEIFNSIKQIKLQKLEENYINKFEKPARLYAENQVKAQIIGQLPRFLIEAVAFGGVILLILILMVNYKNFQTILPIITLYLFAGYRLLPILQQIYISITQIRYSNELIENITNELKINESGLNTFKNNKKIKFDKLLLKNIEFEYKNKKYKSLNNINLVIEKNQTIGIVGKSGSGKTTLIDVIIGLLEPRMGYLEINEKKLNNENLDEWKNSIGYVPQDIYLINDTILANIALGIEEKDIDIEKVQTVLKASCLHEFIQNQLPQKYNTIIGENGIGLSGGQRQRIGIARALYRNPEFLVLDESTNGLDSITENSIMNSILKLSNSITILVVTHRLITLRNLDRILVMNDGKIIADGNFNYLKENCNYFKNLLLSEIVDK